MKIVFTVLLALLAGQAQAAEAKVSFRPESKAAIQTEAPEFRFQLFGQNQKPITKAELKISHEKLLHLVVYDASLQEFQHLHPEFDGKFWQTKLRFSVSGKYWLWAQGALKDGSEFSSAVTQQVNLAKRPAWPSPPELAELRSGVSGNFRATLSEPKLTEKKMAMLDLTFSRVDGSKPKISPYLSAFAHVIGVSNDGAEMVHVHPMDGTKPEQGMLHVMFLRRGMYRLWVQYLDGGELITIPLSVKVGGNS